MIKNFEILFNKPTETQAQRKNQLSHSSFKDILLSYLGKSKEPFKVQILFTEKIDFLKETRKDCKACQQRDYHCSLENMRISSAESYNKVLDHEIKHLKIHQKIANQNEYILISQKIEIYLAQCKDCSSVYVKKGKAISEFLSYKWIEKKEDKIMPDNPLLEMGKKINIFV